MEDNLKKNKKWKTTTKKLKNGRRPQKNKRWKMTSKKNERRPQNFLLKTTSKKIKKIEDDLKNKIKSVLDSSQI